MKTTKNLKNKRPIKQVFDRDLPLTGSINPTQLLKKNGMKVTPLRVKLLEFLAQSPTPLSVEALKKKIKKKGDVVTLYRALAAFEEKQIAESVTLNNAAHYQLSHHHAHHIVCGSCGTIETIPVCAPQLEKRALQKSKKFKLIARHVLEFFGTCRKCS